MLGHIFSVENFILDNRQRFQLRSTLSYYIRYYRTYVAPQMKIQSVGRALKILSLYPDLEVGYEIDLF
jgi:hypothetical protein